MLRFFFFFLHFVLPFSLGDSVWTGSFYVLREDGSLSSYASKDIQGQTPVKVGRYVYSYYSFNFSVFVYLCFRAFVPFECGSIIYAPGFMALQPSTCPYICR